MAPAPTKLRATPPTHQPIIRRKVINIMSQSKYAGDSRVVLNGVGTATMPAPKGYESEGDWVVEHARGGGFTVRNTGDQGYIKDSGDRYNQRPRVFDTVDEALFAVIGDPE